HTGDRNVHQAVEKVPHALGAQRDLDPDRPSLADLEARNGLARLGHDRLLTGQPLQITHRIVDQLLVADRVADTHVQSHLGDPRYLHHVGVAELLFELGHHLVLITFSQVRHFSTRLALGVDLRLRRLVDAYLGTVFLYLKADAICLA